MNIDYIKKDIEKVWNTEYKEESTKVSKDELEALKNSLAARIILAVESLVRDGYGLSEAYEKASLLMITSPRNVEENLPADWSSLKRSISEGGVF